MLVRSGGTSAARSAADAAHAIAVTSGPHVMFCMTRRGAPPVSQMLLVEAQQRPLLTL